MNQRVENVRTIINEMFIQRGYKDIEENAESCITATKLDGTKICAFYNIIEKLNVTEIHNHISLLQKNNTSHGLLVFEGIPTPAVKNVISNTYELKINIELFQADDLQYNITKHILVPEHIRLSKEESKNFKSKYGTDIPVLLRIDPVVKFYDFTKGDIIKIIRKNGFISYRIVR